MGFIIAVIAIGVVITIGSWLLWFAFMIFAARTAVRGVQRGLEQLVPDLERMLSQIPQGGFNQMPPQRQQHLLAMLMQAQTQMSQLNNLSKARYENRVGDLMGMAASAGIDWHP